ncbi:platelet-activating factor acetylhydrolase isoform II [Streptomyces sp. PanSC19]|uniref:alpha/beta hydrolase family protein n=1 Tax=Streptomyces sp. PanSC19 TaxID=1520455 RepID=UPI000F461275|nr:alpha/beta hydrolase [Streptomyces sp. PanSC19]ROQ26434.1 platelet-activating factor acetylhydrolase isoform II [Streptomyces sp. PanSC19]
MIRITRAAAAAVLLCSLALPAGVATAAVPDRPTTGAPVQAAQAEQAATLPAPTGPYAVGSAVLPLVDRSRTDPWVPTADGRALMVTLHYPATRPGGGRPAPYATGEEARLLAEQLGPGVSGDVLARTRTHSRTGVGPAPGRHPLVLLSPGFSVSRWTLTHLAEDLASRGYVVASVDHAYESYGISLPGGRTLTCVACTALEGGVHGSVVTSTRAADVRYVLDRLTGPKPVRRYADMIDPRRVGMAGHSIGGASAASAMVADPRIDAGINMDGAFWEDLPAEGLRGRPFLMLGTHDGMHLPGGQDASWDRTWTALDGWKRWITVAGSEHFTFSDGPVIQRHFGLPQPELPADRAVAVTRTYVAAFFDQHLRGLPRPVLDGPTPANPEVHFQHR